MEFEMGYLTKFSKDSATWENMLCIVRAHRRLSCLWIERLTRTCLALKYVEKGCNGETVFGLVGRAGGYTLAFHDEYIL